MGWSLEQQLAFETCNKNILVAAAAGSGKTTILTERIVRRIIGDPEFDVSKLLVVTFTKAAAMEMSGRIGKRLKEIAEDPNKNFVQKLMAEHAVYRQEIAARKERSEETAELEALLNKYAQYYMVEESDDGVISYVVNESEAAKLQSRLTRQLLRLDDADISTIDSFCQRIIREFGDKIPQEEGKQNFDAHCRIAGETELDILKLEILEDLFLDKYTDAFAKGESDFLSFVENYGSDLNDGKIYEIILKIYDYSVSEADPISWLESLRDDYTDITPDLINKAQPRYRETSKAAVWMNMRREQADILARKAEAQLEIAMEKALEAEAEFGEIKKFGKNFTTIAETVRHDLELVKINAGSKALYEKDWDDIAVSLKEPFGKNFGRFSSAKTDQISEDDLKELEDRKKAIKLIRDAGRADYYKVAAIFAEKSADIAETLQTFGRFAKVAVELVIAFSDRYDQAKKERRIMDFGDLEHEALTILGRRSEDGKWLQTEIGRQILRNKYAEVMVDEYQDVNRLQETLFSLLTRKESSAEGEEAVGPCRFIVGDVKQSIYRFRHSDASLFNDKKAIYPSIDDVCAVRNNPCSVRIDMANNYRSRSAVLQGVNFIFRQLMTKSGAEIDYDEKTEALHFILSEGADGLTVDNGYPYESVRMSEDVEFTDENTELVLIDTSRVDDDGNSTTDAFDENNSEEGELSAFDFEAEYIARRIRELLDSKCHVFRDKDKGIHHAVSPRDITILMRGVKGNGEILREHLNNHGIPAYVTADEGYFQEQEIRVMLSVLRIIDNPRQDIPLAAVLRSPIGGFSDSELAEIRLSASESGELLNFIDVLRQSTVDESSISKTLKDKVKGFLQTLNDWRRLSRETGLGEMIWQLLRDTDYYEYVGAMPGGQLRQANLRLLISRAKEYEAGDSRGLFRFLHYIGQLNKGETDMSQARTLGENEDVVRIMTIHKSKGMQFPIVFLAGIGKQFNRQDERARFVFHHRFGLGGELIATRYEMTGNPEDNNLVRVKQKTVSGEAIKHCLNREMKAEELRLLYVALTRAQEKVIMVGTVKGMETPNKQMKSWINYCNYVRDNTDNLKSVPLPPTAISDGARMVDWIATAVANHRDGEALRRLCCGDKDIDDAFVAKAGYPTDGSSFTVKILDGNLQEIDGEAVDSAEDCEDLAEKTTAKDSTKVFISAADFLRAVEAGNEFSAFEDSTLDESLGAVFDESTKYNYASTDEMRAKVSVTELKRLDMAQKYSENGDESQELHPHEMSYRSSVLLSGKTELQLEETERSSIPAGPEFGTIVHDVLRYAVSRKLSVKDNEFLDYLRSSVDTMCPEKSDETRRSWELAAKKLTGNFLYSSLGNRVWKSKKVYCELPFCRLLTAKEAYLSKYLNDPEKLSALDEIDNSVFLQGVIDLLFMESKDSCILVDYKTDAGIDGDEAKERYHKQMEIYAKAITDITGYKVSEAYLFLLRKAEEVRVSV